MLFGYRGSDTDAFGDVVTGEAYHEEGFQCGFTC